MAISYEKFREMVPKHTLDYVNKLLSYEDYYTTNRYNSIALFSGFNGYSSADRKFAILIASLGNFSDYLITLSKYGYKDKDYYKSVPEGKDYAKLYDKYNYLIPNYDDITLYYSLNPWEIILHSYTDCLEHFTDILPSTSRYRFEDTLNELATKEKQELSKKEEEQVFKYLPASTITYLETAAKIRTRLITKMKDRNVSVIKNVDEDYIPLSLLLAIFYCTKNKSKSIETMTNEELISSLLKEKGLTSNVILKKLGIELPNYEVYDVEDEIIFAIKHLYKKMYELENSNTQNIKITEITPRIILERLEKRQYTNSICIEKLLYELGLDKNILKFSDEELKNIREKSKEKLENERKAEIYDKISTTTLEFLEFAAKTYKLLNKKMQEQKNYNKKIINNQNDNSLLSLLITSYYYDNDLNLFLKDNLITLEKIQELLNIKVTKEEIESTELDSDIIIDIFKKFIDSGLNTEKKTVGINDICNNMCNSNFTKSKLIENLFSKLNSSITLDKNFLSQLKQYLKEKESKRLKELSEKLFHDVKPEVIDIIESASNIYRYVLKNKKEMSKKDMTAISLLLSILKNGENELTFIIGNKGISDESIRNYFSIPANYLYDDEIINLDLVDRNFLDFIFQGINKNKDRKDITVVDILRNVFNNDINDSIILNRFLDKEGTSIDEFQDIEKLYKEYHEEIEKENLESDFKQVLHHHSSDTCNGIKTAIGIFQYIKKQQQKYPEKYAFFDNDDEIATLALLLSVAKHVEYTNTNMDLQRHNLSAKNVLNLCNLSDEILLNEVSQKHGIDYNDLLSQIGVSELDFSVFTEHYRKLLANRSASGIFNEIIRNMFRENKSFLVKICRLANISYDILKREVITGKRYEETLTVNDRIEILLKEDVQPLNIDSMEDVLSYGDRLLLHSRYIYDEVPKLMEVDETSQTVEEVTNVIRKLYVKQQSQEKSTGLISRLFSSQPTVLEKSTISLDSNKMNTLKDIINKYTEELKKELLEYNRIRTYIEQYCRKNSLCYQETTKANAIIEEKKSTLDQNNEDDYFQYVNYNTLLQIINDKSNRFLTSNLLMRKELLRVNQSIVNHFITLNSLEMARDTLIPLIESEVAIAKGKNTEEQALMLCQNIMGLFESLLTRNVDGTLESMKEITQSSIPQEFLTTINKDVQLYINGINQVKSIEKKIENMPNGDSPKLLEKSNK